MAHFLLDDYHLTTREILRSAVFSEYAVRHFEKANQSIKTEDRVFHRLIGCFEIIPLLGGIASAIEGAYATLIRKEEKDGRHFVVKGGVSPLSKAAQSQSKILERRRSQPPEMKDRPFFSKLHQYHGCLNESTLPVFKFHAQGIFRITRNFLAYDKIPEGELRVTFAYQGFPFQVYTEPLDRECYDIFVQNMPMDEEITIHFQIVDGSNALKDIDKLKFTPKYVRGEYLFTTAGNSKTIKSLPLVEPTSIHPGFHITGPGAYSVVRDVQLPLNVIIKNRGGLDMRFDYKPRSPSEQFLIENSSKFPVLLTLDLVPVSDRYETEKAVSYPLIIFPGEKKKFSKDVLLNAWRNACEIATGDEPVPLPHLLDILYIQMDSFGNPYS